MVKQLPPAHDQHLDEVFGALADPTRRHLLQHLSRGPTRVTELAGRFHISLPAVSKHLGVLERAGLIQRQRQGRVHLMSIRLEGMRQAQTWLEFYREFWEHNLDRLEDFLAQQESESSPNATPTQKEDPA